MRGAAWLALKICALLVQCGDLSPRDTGVHAKGHLPRLAADFAVLDVDLVGPSTGVDQMLHFDAAVRTVDVDRVHQLVPVVGVIVERIVAEEIHRQWDLSALEVR